MIVAFEVHCKDDEIFAPDCFDNNIGKDVNINTLGVGTIREAKIVNEGKTIIITVEFKENQYLSLKEMLSPVAISEHISIYVKDTKDF